MGFEFGKHDIEVEIEGKKYIANLANAKNQDAFMKVQRKFEQFDAETLSKNEEANLIVSEALRDLIGGIIGLEAQNEIFENRPNCVIDEISLLNYLYTEVTEKDETESLDSLLANLGIVQFPGGKADQEACV